MKKIKLISLSLIMSGLILSMLWMPMVSAEEESKTITVLFTHDLHDNLLPSKIEQNGTIEEVGGYARLQSAIKEQKELDKDALLIDGGDFSMGTPFQTIFKSDAPELRIMGEMGYDVVTLGNHEFDYRASGLAESLNAAKESGDTLPEIVQANVTYPTDKAGNLTQSLSDLKQEMEDYGVKDYTVIERNGIKIGIFGVMGEESASMAPMSEVVFADEVEYAKKVVKVLQEKEKVDLIVCLSHSGTNAEVSLSEDEILAKKVPELNVIISGHTHTKLSQPIMVGQTMIASGEEYGKNLGVIKLTQETDLSWKLSDYKLIPIDNSFVEDENIAKSVAGYKEIVQQKYFDQYGLEYDEVVAAAPFSFQTIKSLMQQHKESSLGNLISDAYIYAVKKAEGEDYIPIAAAIVPAGTIRGTFLKGNITTGDAFSVSSLGMGADNKPGYPLISVYMTGKELKTICEVDASITPIMQEAQLFLSGMSYTFNPNRLIFNKVTKATLIKEDGTTGKIEEKKLYRIVVGLYSAQMLSVVGEKSYGILSIEPKTKDGTKITDYEAQIIYDTTNGKQSELKEWFAIVDYLKSLKQDKGISQISQYYNQAQDRKIVDNTKNLVALMSHPNKIAMVVYVVIVVVLILIIFVVRKIVKRMRRHKTNKKENKILEENKQ